MEPVIPPAPFFLYFCLLLLLLVAYNKTCYCVSASDRRNDPWSWSACAFRRPYSIVTIFFFLFLISFFLVWQVTIFEHQVSKRLFPASDHTRDIYFRDLWPPFKGEVDPLSLLFLCVFFFFLFSATLCAVHRYGEDWMTWAYILSSRWLYLVIVLVSPFCRWVRGCGVFFVLFCFPP